METIVYAASAQQLEPTLLFITHYWPDVTICGRKSAKGKMSRSTEALLDQRIHSFMISYFPERNVKIIVYMLEGFKVHG
jgi:hypothetical protein